jgi:hypothetical protein
LVLSQENMQKISLALLVLFLFVTPVNAANVSITQLPGYINYTDFKLSCSALGASSAQFSSRKDDGGYTNFGPSIDLNTTACQVQVTGTQFGSEGKFWFKVTLNDGSFAETSTTLDTTAPGGISDFGKDRVGGGTTYKLHWKNPSESDYQRVFIYRGTEPGFEANGDHKIAEAGGAPSDTMTWDDGGLDPTKEYYYVIRALDRANNSSGLAGDAQITSTTSTTTGGSVAGAATGAGRVTTLPVEEGQVLGEDLETPAPEAASTENIFSEIGKGLSTIQKIGIGLGALVITLGVYFFAKRRKS